MRAKTLFDKIWDDHVVYQKKGYPAVFYIDTHLIHEVTSPQAFAGLKKRGIPLFRKERTWATADHNVPTQNQHLPIKEALSKKQVDMLIQNCKDFDIKLFGLGHPFQGIVHVIGPELGITQPGMTIVCGDSHTSTHGAFGTIAFGIGTSEIEQVFATQTILQNKPKTMKIEVNGKLQKGVLAKDIILYIISQIGVGGATGYFVEYAGTAISSLSMEARMTICNMSIEMGARGGLIAPDDTTFNYIKGREFAPKGTLWDKTVKKWKKLVSDKGAKYDKVLQFDAKNIQPMITFGTNPGMGIPITGKVPDDTPEKVLSYMGITKGEKMIGKKIDYVFIGSCTNSRIEDLRIVAQVVKGKKKSSSVYAFIVPGSKQVELQAKKEGLDVVLKEAGFELRQPGCSACLAMNEDKIPQGKYCVSTSNRNFEGRQGPGSRTFLASPLTAAVAALTGKITDPRKYI
jgi:3-isopropylmalate/(R)-2-methylmalate dehydratase large subunit